MARITPSVSLALGLFALCPAAGRADAAVDAQAEGEAAVRAGDYGGALAALNLAVALDPTRAEAYFSRGVIYWDLGEADPALSDFSAAIRRRPTWAEAYNNRGSIYWTLGQFDRAMADYDEAIRLKPDFAGAYYNRASGHRRANRNAAALADWAEALRLKPDFPEVYASRAFLHRAQADYARARSDYEAALKLNPRLASALGGLAWLAACCPDAAFRNGRRAVDYAVQACELTRYEDYAFLLILAAAYAEAGRFPEAVKLQQQILGRPDLTDARRNTSRERLALYEKKQPYRAPWPAGTAPAR